MASSTKKVPGRNPSAVVKTKSRKPARGSNLPTILGVSSALFFWGIASFAMLKGLSPDQMAPSASAGYPLPRPELAIAQPLKSTPDRIQMRDHAALSQIHQRFAAAIAESDRISLLMLPAAMQLVAVDKSDRLLFTRVESIATAEAMNVLREVLAKAAAERQQQAAAVRQSADHAEADVKPPVDPVTTASIPTTAPAVEMASVSPTVPALGYAATAPATTVMAEAQADNQPFAELLIEDAASDHDALPDDGPLPSIRPRVAAIPDPEPSVAESVAKAAPQKPAKVETKPERKTLFNMLAYAKPDNPVTTDDGAGGIFNRKDKLPGPGSRIAVYVIEDGVVHMPNGEKLQAHSGRGNMRDNPKFVHVKNFGPTPPNVYSLRMRESRFHGVEAIRMTPVGSAKMYNRDGFLTHTYLLRRRGDSSGCVVFDNYPRFLNAFKRGDVKTLIVVPSMRHLPTYLAML
ncbi:hypothetical protein IP76_20250 [Rhizobium sp. AAP43]|nr:hypothetical protein IP76_20250 [Rhizobium sp. AAP43]